MKTNLSQFYKNFTQQENTTGIRKPLKKLFTGPGESYKINSSDIIAVCGENIVGVGDLNPNAYPNTPQLEIIGEGYIDVLGVFQTENNNITVTTKVIVDDTEIVELGVICAKGKGYWIIGSNIDDIISRTPIYFYSTFKVYTKFNTQSTGNKGTIGFGGGLY